MPLIVCPITISEACLFVNRVHRHHKAPQGALFALACAVVDVEGNAANRGVALVGRPVSRKVAVDSWCAEVTRVAVDGIPHACSLLYAACWRAARALGYRRLITYTLKEESGISLRAAGWVVLGECRGGSWNSKSRPRVDKHPTQEKIKWQRND